MSAGRDVERLIALWLVEEAADGAPDRVLDSTRERLDHTRQRPRAAWRPSMNPSLVRLTAVSAVVVVAVAAIMLLKPSPGPGGPPPPTALPTATTGAAATTSSGAAALPLSGAIPPGVYEIGAPLGIDVTATFTTPEWRVWSGRVSEQVVPLIHRTPDAPNLGIIIVQVKTVYANACVPSGGLADPPPGDTVDDLVEALLAQPNESSTGPTDVEISGFSGKHIEYSFAIQGTCARLSRWPTDQGDREAIPRERDELWILDVDGTRWVIDLFSFATTTPVDIDEARAIVEGLVIKTR
jgi:hypothetical protein